MAYINVAVSHAGPIKKYHTGKVVLRKDNQILKLYDEEKKEFDVIKLESVGEYLLVVHQITVSASKCSRMWAVGRYNEEVALSRGADIDYQQKDEALRWLKTQMNMFVRTPTDLDFRASLRSAEDVYDCEFFLELYYKS